MRSITIEGRKFRTGVQLIRTVTICNVRVPIIRATADQVPELVEDGRLLDGFFCFERAVIVIRAGQAPSLERDAICHEVSHAFLYLSGLAHVLRGQVKTEYTDFEEQLVRIATPHIVALLLSEGSSWAA